MHDIFNLMSLGNLLLIADTEGMNHSTTSASGAGQRFSARLMRETFGPGYQSTVMNNRVLDQISRMSVLNSVQK